MRKSTKRLTACTVMLCMFFTMISGASAKTWDCDVDGHHYIETILREGTCAQAEIIKKVCEYCNDIKYVNNGFKHSFEDQILPATCTDPEAHRSGVHGVRRG